MTFIACGTCGIKTLPSVSLQKCCDMAKAKGWVFDERWYCPKCPKPVVPKLNNRDTTQDKAHIMAGIFGLRAAGWTNDMMREFLIEKMYMPMPPVKPVVKIIRRVS